VYVDNVVSANLRAAAVENAAGQAFNIGGGAGISILALLSELERATGEALNPSFGPARAGDVRHSVASIRRAQAVLRYEPRVPFGLGLRQTIAAAAPVTRAGTPNPGVLVAA